MLQPQPSKLPSLKQISILDAKGSNSPSLYVMNNSRGGPNGGPAEILFEWTPTHDQQSRIIKIPVSWSVIDLARVVPRDILLDHPTFQGLVLRDQDLDKRLGPSILLIDSVSAEKFLNTNPAALKEQQRAYRLLFGMAPTAPLTQQKPLENQADVLAMEVAGRPAAAVATPPNAEPQPRISNLAQGEFDENTEGVEPKVVDIMNRPDEELNDDQRLLSLQGIQLSEQDRMYIANKTGNAAILAYINQVVQVE